MIPVYSGFGLDRLHCNILNQSSDLQCKYDKKKNSHMTCLKPIDLRIEYTYVLI